MGKSAFPLNTVSASNLPTALFKCAYTLSVGPINSHLQLKCPIREVPPGSHALVWSERGHHLKHFSWSCSCRSGCLEEWRVWGGGEVWTNPSPLQPMSWNTRSTGKNLELHGSYGLLGGGGMLFIPLCCWILLWFNQNVLIFLTVMPAARLNHWYSLKKKVSHGLVKV